MICHLIRKQVEVRKSSMLDENELVLQIVGHREKMLQALLFLVEVEVQPSWG